MRARTPLHFLLPLFLLWGCGGETFSDYNLKLVPHQLQGQEPFMDGRVIKLMIQEPDSEPEFIFIGNTGGVELEMGELPPISPGSVVGILVEEQGGDANAFNIDLAVAWGSNIVDGGLALGGEELTIDILVPELNKLGDMDRLPEGQRVLRPAAAMGQDDVYLFGGSKGLRAGDFGSSKILKMSEMDAGNFMFDRLDIDMPTYDAVDGFYGPAAVNIDVDGEPHILVTGGRMDAGNTGQASNGAFLLNPATDEIIWGTKPNHSRMNSARSEHRMLVMNNGKALIYGGLDASLNSSFEIF
ncbi:MAG: hypothetical protein GWP91_11015, partial [Rhodobacterales bacterium]|nr:hypothetical protein [Rhodobacterales bacterium]